MGLLRFELVTHERRHARLDSTGAERNQTQHAVAETINHRAPENRLVTPDELVRQPCAEQRHEIIAELEKVNDGRGIVLRLAEAADRGRVGDVTSENADDAVVT